MPKGVSGTESEREWQEPGYMRWGRGCGPMLGRGGSHAALLWVSSLEGSVRMGLCSEDREMT